MQDVRQSQAHTKKSGGDVTVMANQRTEKSGKGANNQKWLNSDNSTEGVIFVDSQ